jgi:hypothetical protein
MHINILLLLPDGSMVLCFTDFKCYTSLEIRLACHGESMRFNAVAFRQHMVLMFV